jgi:hypothetical protein
MNRTDINESRRRLHELAETQHWAHHVADLDSGKILTFPLDRPVAPLSRAKRLLQLGHRVDPSIFGGIFGWGPSYELSAHVPYQYSPLAYLSVYNADLYDGAGDTIQWWPPQQEANPPHRQMSFVFTVSPAQRCLVSIELSAKPWPGTVGHVSVGYNTGSVSVPINAYESHLVDVTFIPGNQIAGINMSLETGIELLVFDQISLVTLPPVSVFDPGTA